MRVCRNVSMNLHQSSVSERCLVRTNADLRRQESRTEEEYHATNTNIYHKSSLWHRKGLEG